MAYVVGADVTMPAASQCGHMRAVRDSIVVLDLEPTTLPEELAGTTCVVTFRQGSRVRAFLVPVQGVEHLGDVKQLLLEVPTEILGADARTAFRVPILDPLWVSVRLRVGKAWMRADPVDLSLSGVQVDLPDGHGLQVDDTVLVDLSRDHRSVRLQGEVRRVGTNRCGLFFASVLLKDGVLDPPEDLIGIVRELERIWIQERPDIVDV